MFDINGISEYISDSLPSPSIGTQAVGSTAFPVLAVFVVRGWEVDPIEGPVLGKCSPFVGFLVYWATDL